MPPHKKRDKSRVNLADDELEWLKPKVLMKPDVQLLLTDTELEEELARVLTTFNPQFIPDEIGYNYGQGTFMTKPKPTFGKAYPLYIFQGTAIRKDSDEAKAQIAAGYATVSFDDAGPKRAKIKKDVTEEEEEEEEQPELVVDEVKDELVEEEEKPQLETIAEKVEDEVGGEAAVEEEQQKETMVMDEEEAMVIRPRVTKLANQFNFCERAALTFIPPHRSVEMQSEEPCRLTYGATALQSIIFNHYEEDFNALQTAKESTKRKERKKKVVHVKSAQQIHDENLSQRIREAWAILERIVNQNLYEEIAMDFRYWDDPSDEFREGMGSLLPLWHFKFEPMKRHTVTDVQWNPHYKDLFAVTFGSLDFMNPRSEGCLCMYSIKNPAFPEYYVNTESPVMCVDVNRTTPYFVCVGCFDGNVLVYNAQLALETSYQYKSDSVHDKHRNIVWEVRWGPRLIDGEATFFSVSGDGRVIQWAVMPGELIPTTIVTLYSKISPIKGPDGTRIIITSCGSCLTFHPEDEDLFMVGTEDGMIHTCSRHLNRNYVYSIAAHQMPVYRISYNKFNHSLFASCSGDWRVLIFEDKYSEPLFMFNLGAPVGDVKWAPYSSTVFAACTADGKVFVYDLNVNRYRPICSQAVVSIRNRRLTRLDFNPFFPIIVCGDTKGTCHVVKLSPNLRVMCKPPKKATGPTDQETLQINKLNKLLTMVRDPPFTVGVVDDKFN